MKNHVKNHVKKQIISRQISILILCILGFSNIVEAQCEFGLSVEIEKHSTCIANGIVNIKIEEDDGNELDFSKSSIQLYSNSGGLQGSVDGKISLLHQSLSPGTYTAQAIVPYKDISLGSVTCYTTVTILSQYKALGVTTTDSGRSSLNCANTGMVSINIGNDSPPYKIEMTSYPSGYSGDTVFSLSYAGNIEIQDLAPGDYVFRIADKCESTVEVSATVDAVANDFPSNPYGNFDQKGCETAIVSVNNDGANYYWTFERNLYDVAFILKGDDSTKEWKSKEYDYSNYDKQSVKLPNPYKELYANDAKMMVYMRMPYPGCEQLVDSILFNKPDPADIGLTIHRTCHGYQLDFGVINDHSMCPPFKWTILDDDSEGDTVFVKSEDIKDIDAFGVSNPQSAYNLLYDKNYILQITDNNDSVIIQSFAYKAPEPVEIWLEEIKNCTNYDLSFYLSEGYDVCLPFKWEILDDDSEGDTLVIDGSKVINDFGISNPQLAEKLRYGKNYILKITDKSDTVITKNFRYIREMSKPDIVQSYDENNCDEYTMKFSLSGGKNDLCTPLKWEIFDLDSEDDTLVTGEYGILDVESFNSKSVGHLLYGKNYILKVTDYSDTVIADTFFYKRHEPEHVIIHSSVEPKCGVYALNFSLSEGMCPPFKWEIYDTAANTLVCDSTNIKSFGEQYADSLKYGKTYRLEITDHNNFKKSHIFKQGQDLTGVIAIILNERRTCGDFTLDFSLSHESSMCPPFKWELRDIDMDKVADTCENITNFNTQSIKNLLYNKNYSLEITDGNGTTVKTDTIRQEQSTPRLSTIDSVLNIYTYDLNYLLSDIHCSKYTWEVRDIDDSTVVIKKNEDNDGLVPEGSINGLEYDKEYIINIFDSSGIVSFHYMVPEPERSVVFLFGTVDTVDGHSNWWACDGQKVMPISTNINIPYRWVLMKSDSTFVKSGTIESEGDIINGLPYDTNYILMITDDRTTFYLALGKAQYPAPNVKMGVSDYQCVDYALSLTISSMYCYPYYWKILDPRGDSIVGGTINKAEEGVMNPVMDNSEILWFTYDSVYKIRITDGADHVFDTILVFEERFPYIPYLSHKENIDRLCDDYDYVFQVHNIKTCFPYKWAIYDHKNNLFDTKEDIYDIRHYDTVKNLKYDENYSLIVTDLSGRGDTLSVKRNSTDVKFDVWNIQKTAFQCSDYTLMFNVRNVLCFPYKWEVYDEDNKYTFGGNAYHDSAYKIPLKYDTNYKITITDHKGRDTIFHSYTTTSILSPYMYNETESNYECQHYTFNFKVATGCTPYSLEVFDNKKQSIYKAEKMVKKDNDTTYSVRLEYDKEYTIKIIDAQGRDSTVTYKLKASDIQKAYITVLEETEKDFQCSDYAFVFKVKNEYCFPYQVEVYNGNTRLIDACKYSISESTFRDSLRFKYDTTYTVTVTDFNNHKKVFTCRKSNYYTDPEIKGSVTNKQCNDYNYEFHVDNMNCYPYTWEIYDKDNGEPVKSGTVTDKSKDGNHVVKLKRDTNYEIKITDNNGREDQLEQRLNTDTAPPKFRISSQEQSVTCLSDMDKRFIKIEGTLDSARVQFVDGPQSPVHTDIVLAELATVFYPFSLDYRYPEPVFIAEGTYKFKITTKCGFVVFVDTLFKRTQNPKDFKIDTIDKTTDLCKRITRVYPSGKILDAENNVVPSYFVMRDSPDPDSQNQTINESEYFSLTETGKYVIGIFSESLNCVIDTISIDYVTNKLDLEGRSSYVCKAQDNAKGEILVQAKGGSPPYTYRLLNKDGSQVKGIAANNSGEFHHGSYNETYMVEVKDNCNSSYRIEVTINTIDPTTLLGVKPFICKGETIVLSCLLLGATSYEWSGPDGFTSKDRIVTIPNATVEHSGVYTVKVKPVGCDMLFESEINVNVRDIPAPQFEDRLGLCQSEETTVLSAVPAGTNSIRWYSNATSGEPIEAPKIDHNGIRNYAYYVTQVERGSSCESERQRIDVTINPEPEQNATATGWACVDGYPQITVNNVVAGYNYVVCTDAECTDTVEVFTDAARSDTVKTFTGTGETMSVELFTTLKNTTTFYLHTATSVGCSLPSAVSEFQVDVNVLEIFPGELGAYIPGTPYYVELESTTGDVVYSSTSDLISGITITPDGIISGTVSAEGYEESAFTVTVTDKHDCTFDKEYIMLNCAPAPGIPEAQLSYCYNSQSVPLQTSLPESTTLKWYDDQQDPLDEAPTPVTDVIGEQIFYVSQMNEELQCEGKKAEVKVKVTPLPTLDFIAPDVNVCIGKSPVISLSNLNEDYVYDVYADAQMIDKLASITETESDTEPLSSISSYVSTAVYINVTDSLKCSDGPVPVGINVIDLKILPDVLPVYVHGERYRVQLESNAGGKEFTSIGELVTGITMMEPEGLISGTVPASAGHVESIFTAMVSDTNGCVAEKEYILRSCGTAPVVNPETQLSYCFNSQSVPPLQASPRDGLTLQWYDAQYNKLEQAIPNTTIVGEQIFYVSQIDEVLRCESDTAEVKITVTPLPEPAFGANENICFGDVTVLKLKDLNRAYTYDIYSDAQMWEHLVTISGRESEDVTIPFVPEPSISYYILETDNLNCSAAAPVEVKTKVIKLELFPKELPFYAHGVPYSVQLWSKAEEPKFTYTGDVIRGLRMAPDGLISGIIPASANYKEYTIDVTLTDKNECQTDHQYILRSCGPAPETPESELFYCIDSPSQPLEATPLDGLTLRWYDKDMKGYNRPPAPNTDVLGEQIFYVSQINEELQCESEKAMIKVTIVSLPEPDFEALDTLTCYGSSPVIVLDNLHRDYVYDVYADAQMKNLLATVTGKGYEDVTISTALETETSYYIKMTDNYKCSTARPVEVKVKVVKPEIFPEELPVYERGIPYRVQLRSDVQKPKFSYTGNFVTGITMTTPEGLINGTVLTSTDHEEATFTATVTDKNGCTADREYLLRSCGPVPVLKPDTKLSYCINSQSVQPLQALPLDGHTLQWYDDQWNPLDKAPTPKTDTVGEQMFYVSQINAALHCETEKAEVKVTVTPLPEPVFVANRNVCSGEVTVLKLKNLNSAYTYDVYADAQMRKHLATVVERESEDVTIPVVPEPSISYYILETDDRKCSAAALVEIETEVIELDLFPEELPLYAQEIPYSVQLKSNIEQAVFTYTGDVVRGLDMSSDGLISGTIPVSANYKEFTIIATVSDVNECQTSREYILSSCGPAPVTETELFYCVGSLTKPLEATPSNGLTLKWYDEDMNGSNRPPVPDTDVPGEQIFYVSQMNEKLQCESEIARIKVTVAPLPMPDFGASDAITCYGSSPVIALDNLHRNYVYDIYADARMENLLTSVTGKSYDDVTLPTVPETSTSYYILMTDNQQCSSATSVEVKITVIKVDILLPDELPIYKHGVPYSVQLESQAEQPEFSYTGRLVTGITMTTSGGLISGTVPTSAGHEESTFTATVTDKSGCATSREYILRSCGPAPVLSSETPLSYCFNTPSISPLRALPRDGYTLQWYDDQLNPLNEAPTPRIDIVGEQIFYVSQKNAYLQCESDTAEVKITVIPLPEPAFEVNENVCSGEVTVLKLKNLNSAYTYDIYSDAQMREHLATVSGRESEDVTLPFVPEASISYYIRETNNLNCSAAALVEVKTNVIDMELLPEELPIYAHGIPYSVQLESNTEKPLFTYAGDVVRGLDMSSDGLISGTIPASADYKDFTIIATVSDTNECWTSREYVLRNCGPAPVTETELFYCVGSPTRPLEAALSEGFTLRWYDEDMNWYNRPPVPDTNVPGEQIFYVSQINEDLQCESERARIKVTVAPLPIPDFGASDAITCYGNSPVIAMDNLHSNYVYDIYADARMENLLTSVTGKSYDNVTLPTVPETSTSYYILITDNQQCSSATSVEVKITVIKVELFPDELPIYTHGIPYSVQLESQAERPEFSYTGSLVTGITMTMSGGLISGTVPASAGHEESTFTATVTDKSGCATSKEYILRSCGPAPVLSPETPLSYCFNTPFISPLRALPRDGYTLQWYDDQLNPLDEAPTPRMDIVGEQIFYISQKNAVLQCESDTAEVRITVTPLPEPAFEVNENVCSGEVTVLKLKDLNSAYTYNIYSDAQMREHLATVSGRESEDVTLPFVPEPSISYYIMETDDRNCLAAAPVEVKTNVITMELYPEELPPYEHGVPYSVQLGSNTEEPVFTYTGDFVRGLSMAPDGLISGTIPASASYNVFTITVTVSDANKCQTSRDYILRSCGVAPEVSEAELSYCLGSKAVPLQALSPRGLPLQWYEAVETVQNKLFGAPVPSTAVVGEQIYYVSQVNDVLQCESEKAEIKVTVKPLPESDIEAADVRICYGSSPVVALTKLNSAFVYDIYSDARMTDKLTSVAGTRYKDVTLPTVPEESTTYYIQVTDKWTCSAEAPVEVEIEVIKPDISPTILPGYKPGVPYSAQFTSHAEEPVFSNTGDIITGVSMTSDGLLSGTVPESVGYEDFAFTVTVTDKNACATDNPYILSSCGPAPETPEAELTYCYNTQSVPALRALSLDGYTLQWYDEQLNPLDKAIPNTTIIGEQIYYVSQVKEGLQCESEIAEIRVTITPLPTPDIEAPEISICRDSSSVVKLTNLRSTYLYDIYADAQMTEKLASIIGVESGVINLSTELESATAYYIWIIDSLGCQSADRLEVPIEIIDLYIQPETLSPYFKSVYYEQILLTNAGQPEFTVSEGDLPRGLSLSPSGTLSGKVPYTEYSIMNIFTVEVRDEKGCRATRSYTLYGDVFAPKIFTPNGDGINDIFMPRHKIVVFDRLGIKMYEGESGWDGTRQGKRVPQDIYFYLIEYKDNDGIIKIITGYVGVQY